MKVWYVYIVRCCDQTLYTGITTDIKARLDAHNKGRGAKYTSLRLPVELVYIEEKQNRSEASKREYQIKNFSRKQKLNLISKIKQ